MQDKPLVSVIMNCYNSDEFLQYAIDSVLSQTYDNFEIIFWDNMSTDNSASIVKSYNDKRIKYFYAPRFTPLYCARNYAMQKADGEFVTFLDCDDLWCKDKLEKQVKIMLESKCGLCYTNYYELGVNGMVKAFVKRQPSGEILSYQIKDYSIGILTVMISKHAWDSMEDKFDQDYNFSGDYDFFIRFLFKQRACYINEPLAFYRISNTNSISNQKKFENLQELQKCIKKLKLFFMNKNTIQALDIFKTKVDLKTIFYHVRHKDFYSIFIILRNMDVLNIFSYSVILWIVSKGIKKIQNLRFLCAG